ncbi:MAG: response regulator [Bdellovibrionales bacterium]
MINCLLVEDEVELCGLISEQLSDIGFIVDAVYSAEEGLNKISGNSYNIVVTDIKLPGMNGIQMMEKIQADLENPPIFVMSGYSDYEAADIINIGLQCSLQNH